MEESEYDRYYAAIGAPNSLSIEQRERLMESVVKHEHMNKEDHRAFYEHCSKRNRQAISILKGEPRSQDYPERWASSLERIRADPKKREEYGRMYKELLRFTDEKEAEFRE